MATSDPAWAVLSRRSAGLPAEAPVEDVPDWLYRHLKEWLYHVLQNTDGPIMVSRPGHGQTAACREVMLRMRIDEQPWLLSASDPRVLDALDTTVRWTDFGAAGSTNRPGPDALEELLASANSVWRVNAQRRGLESRIDPTITAAVASTIRNAPADAAGHLATAWDAAYGRAPDPDKTYDEAVLAVEALLCPLVCQNNPRRTLGTVIRDLGHQAGQWELSIGDTDGQPATVVTPLVEMLALLWHGQSRHAGSPNSRHQSQTEAEAAVHLAATIVQWITREVLRRKP